MAKPLYKTIPNDDGSFYVVDLNGRGRIHGVEIVASDLATREEADALIGELLYWQTAALSTQEPEGR